MRITDNSVLGDLTLPRLSYVKDLEVRRNARLLNLTANMVRRADRVYLKGNFTNVELFSLEEVTGDFRVVGAPSMDCSWFDQNFFQKIVKGSYQCTGNHTAPALPRKPSTPTSLDELEDPDGGGRGGGGGPTNGTESAGTADGGLSPGAKAGTGVGAAVGAIVLLGLRGVYLWKKKKKQSVAPMPEAQPGDQLDKSKLGVTAVAKGHVKAEGDVAVLEADSKEAQVELDHSPRGQAGTREEIGESRVRSELPSDGTKVTAELPG